MRHKMGSTLTRRQTVLCCCQCSLFQAIVYAAVPPRAVVFYNEVLYVKEVLSNYIVYSLHKKLRDNTAYLPIDCMTFTLHHFALDL